MIINKEDVGACTYTTIDPRSPTCYWHRLLRTTGDGQALAAAIRLKAAPMPARTRVPSVEWPAGERWCAGCQSMVPLFYVCGSRCKACARVAAQEARRETIYGLAPEAWQALMALQDGLCAICRNKQRDRSPAVEHDHSGAGGVKSVRGGACVKCNHEVLGGAFDSPRIIASALIYLLAPPASGRWVKPEISVDPVIRAVGAVLDELHRADRDRERAERLLSALDASALDDDLDDATDLTAPE